MALSSEREITSENIRLLTAGFEGLRSGSLYMIIATLLGFIAIMVIYFGAGFGLSVGSIGGAVGSIIAGGVLVLIAAIIGVLGLVKWQHGGSYFKQFDAMKFGYAETGPKLMLWGLYIVILAAIILIIGAAAKSPGVVVGGSALLIIAAIIDLIGYILFGIFLLRIKDLNILYGLSLPDFTIDAVLWFIGIVVGILTFIAVILIYVHSGEALTGLTIKERELAEKP